LNAEHRQAGVEVLTHEEFLATPHGQETSKTPLWLIEPLEQCTPPVPFSVENTNTQILQGIKVLELCRIIAGPTITRILAEYGAEVLKVTSSQLPDVPFFQVDGFDHLKQITNISNIGKRTTDLDLKDSHDRAIFETLLEDVDVIVDGYRPGALSKLGYGVEQLSKFAEKRGKGIIYVNENCFGYKGVWANRPGWQQIADCASGLAWAQGLAMGINEPMVPPFPMSDYGTGIIGAIVALTGILKRATEGGSWWGGASLLAYDMFLFRLGMYPDDVWYISLISI
jgi:crotonobetainyl-CoA:carnitine CoA-transferase CaiB-like acyl-CoA transferase